MKHSDHSSNHGHSENHHFILPVKTVIGVGIALLILTWFTVWIAGVDLGRFNFFVALVVATFKASLVALVFMTLKYDKKENGLIFGTSFLFLAIFIVLTVTDLFFRGDVYVKGPLIQEVAASGGPSKFKTPWVATPELVAHGKEIYGQQCVSCHGAGGKGDGPAAAALNPHPRNFHSGEGWTKGRKPSQVYLVLSQGIAGTAMASYGTLAPADRWALTHYVLSLGPHFPADAVADLKAIGVDPSKEDGGAGEQQKPTVPVEFMMELMAREAGG